MNELRRLLKEVIQIPSSLNSHPITLIAWADEFGGRIKQCPLLSTIVGPSRCNGTVQSKSTARNESAGFPPCHLYRAPEITPCPTTLTACAALLRMLHRPCSYMYNSREEAGTTVTRRSHDSHMRQSLLTPSRKAHKAAVTHYMQQPHLAVDLLEVMLNLPLIHAPRARWISCTAGGT